MTLGRPLSAISLVSFVVLASLGGCDGPQGTTTKCSAGAERCACYPNKTCNDGLVCYSSLCVNGAGATGNVNEAGGSAIENGGVTNSGGQSSSTTWGSTALGQGGGSTTSVEQGGTTVVGTGGTTVAIGQGGTSALGTGGTTVVGTGGTTVAIGQGGTSALGTGGTVAAGDSEVLVLGPNLVSNGDFSQDTAFWHVTSSAGSEMSTASVGTDGAYCIAYYAGYSAQVIGWPVLSANTITLRAGTKYVLSYRIKGPTVATVATKVGLFSTPYTAIATASAAYLTADWAEVRYMFTTTATQSTTALYGIAFTITYLTSGQACLDDVVLAEVIG